VSGKTTLETFLSKKCGTHDFSVGTGLVFHEMVGIISDRKTGIIAHLAEWHIGGTDITVGKTALTGGNRNAGRSLGGSTNGR
jgi:hypothetical protein